ncbi:hypothetical protein pb186bvf_015442 [Paramecium bursaria]
MLANALKYCLQEDNCLQLPDIFDLRIHDRGKSLNFESSYIKKSQIKQQFSDQQKKKRSNSIINYKKPQVSPRLVRTQLIKDPMIWMKKYQSKYQVPEYTSYRVSFNGKKKSNVDQFEKWHLEDKF